MPSKGFKLNIATIPEWNILLNNQEHSEVNSEILFYFYKNSLDNKESKLLRSLLKEQKIALADCKIQLETDVKTGKKISEKIDYLKNDDRLSKLFSLRINDAMNKGLINNFEDVNDVFHKLMEEDMDLDKHEELIKEYEIIKKDGNVVYINSFLEVDDANFVHNSNWSDEEIEFADQRMGEFVNAGLMINNGSYENELYLMIMILRLESIIIEFYDSPEDEDD